MSTRVKINGAWLYDKRDFTAALLLGLSGGLRLDDLDDEIEAAQAEGHQDAVRFLEQQRARLLYLLDKDANGDHVRDAARLLAALLREAKHARSVQLGEKSSKAHAIAAAATRKLWPGDIAKIEIEYQRRVKAGDRHGAITDLAAKWQCSTKTISRIVKPKRK